MEQSYRPLIKGTIIAVSSGVCYGVFPIIAKFVFACGINNATVLFLRFFGCIVFLWGGIFITKENPRIPIKKMISLLLLGGIVYGLMSALNLYALTKISASLASLILCLYPIFVMIVLIILKKEQLTIRKIVALSISIGGLILLLDIKSENVDFIGLVTAIGASFAYTAYVILASDISNGIKPLVSCAYIMSGATIIYGFTGIMGNTLNFDFAIEGWIYIMLMASVSTALPVFLFWSGVKLLGPTKASVIGMIEPISTVVLAMLIFNEFLTGIQTIGAIGIVFGIALIQIPKKSSS